MHFSAVQVPPLPSSFPGSANPCCRCTGDHLILSLSLSCLALPLSPVARLIMRELYYISIYLFIYISVRPCPPHFHAFIFELLLLTCRDVRRVRRSSVQLIRASIPGGAPCTTQPIHTHYIICSVVGRILRPGRSKYIHAK